MSEARAEDSQRGRRARWPWSFPLRGWRDILLRVKEEVSRDNLPVVAAGVAFFGFLTFVPLLAAVISVYGLVSDPAAVAAQIQALSDILPEAATGLINQELERLAAAPSPSLGLGALTSILVTLWSATRGSRALIAALNIVYEERDQRGWLRSQVVAYLMTTCAVLVAIVTLGLLVVLPLIWERIGLGRWPSLFDLLRWPTLVLVALLAIGALYRYAPDRRRAKTRWVSWGAILATGLWLFASWLFAVYVEEFASYSASFGSVSAVVVLLLWLFISAFVILLGAELNAEMEHQTAQDTTRGPPRPLGERGAYVADHIGPVP